MKKYAFASRSITKDHILNIRNNKILEHRLIMYNHIGYGPHKCHWCKEDVNWNFKKPHRLVVDHLDGDSFNNNIDNLVPSCDFCNNGRHWRESTHCLNGHEFTKENTYLAKRTDGGLGRRCKTCKKNRQLGTPR